MPAERDKRKEQLLELQQSKQDRSEMELANMRELYERQQRDLAVLHLNLENTKEIVDKQQVRLLHQRYYYLLNYKITIIRQLLLDFKF